MKREIKYRSAHYKIDGKFSHFSYWGMIDHKGNHSDDCFTSPANNSGTFRKYEEEYMGLNDKNGVKIFKGDILRVKHKISNNENYYVDALYAVDSLSYDGLSLYCVKPTMSEDVNNQYPINQSLSIGSKLIREDYANKNYDKIAIMDSWGENHISQNRWRENHYSNDIEIYGNIHKNHELFDR